MRGTSVSPLNIKVQNKVNCLKPGRLSGEGVHFWNCGLGFDSESGQTNHFELGIHSFPA